MSAAEENTRGKRMAAKRGTRINNTNKVDFSGAKIGAFNSGNSSSSAAAGKGARATSKTATKDKKVVGGMAMMMMMNGGGSGRSGGRNGGSGKGNGGSGKGNGGSGRSNGGSGTGNGGSGNAGGGSGPGMMMMMMNKGEKGTGKSHRDKLGNPDKKRPKKDGPRNKSKTKERNQRIRAERQRRMMMRLAQMNRNEKIRAIRKRQQALRLKRMMRRMNGGMTMNLSREISKNRARLNKLKSSKKPRTTSRKMGTPMRSAPMRSTRMAMRAAMRSMRGKR